MATLSKDIKLLTLSLILRTMPRDQQSLLMAHFSPEVAKVLAQIEQETKVDVEKLDWTPFYQSWPELQKILNDCKREIKSQKVSRIADEQRAKLKEYILIKLGIQKKGPPVFLSQEVTKIVDKFLTDMEKMK
ncbi:MAG: hypothetical protein HY094_04425 [Candidatus Melainabacteria bacterium]|nr:hypothetical protein [Candidatus Melainabacteria bacterium]